MKVILRQDYEALGHIGDVVEVKDGYARNYLLPRNIAYQATEGSLRVLEEEKRQNERRHEKEKKSADNLGATLSTTSVTLKMKVGEEDKLYGSVTSQMIAEQLEAQGITIDKRSIELEEPIKALGVYEVPVKLHPKVISTLKVWVVAE
ncbi:MAG: 50S ribosomal protein L9 [Bacteroidota bacterium]